MSGVWSVKVIMSLKMTGVEGKRDLGAGCSGTKETSGQIGPINENLLLEVYNTSIHSASSYYLPE